MSKTRRSRLTVVLLAAIVAASGCADDVAGDDDADAGRTGGCGVADPETGMVGICSPSRSEVCVCTTGRCASVDTGCESGYRYITGSGECVRLGDATVVIESNSQDDLCPGGADADADGDGDGDADGDGDGDGDEGDTRDDGPTPDDGGPRDDGHGDDGGDAEPVCGNGSVEGTEECDDGNPFDTDDCLGTCVLATCGDGFIHDGVETCDGEPPRECSTPCFSSGTQACVDCNWEETCTPPEDACNGADEDCDGTCDDGFACCALTTTACATTCGTSGTQDCDLSCTPGACVPPPESCNGADDDCDGECDEGWSCCAGTSASCTTTCSTTGTQACSASCLLAACVPPAETCNRIDDDCDGMTDEVGAGFACGDGCCNGAETYCSCSADCTTVVPSPSTPRPLVPANGALTGRYTVAARLRPTFRWLAPTSGGCGTVRYDVQVDDSCTTPGFTTCTLLSPEASATSLAATSWAPTASLPVSSMAPVGRRYYWRMRACDGAAGCSAWTAVRYLDVGRVPSDFDGDGYSDLAVGAPRRDSPSTNAGMVAVFRGSATGISLTASWFLQPPAIQGGALFGTALATLDANADGFADLVAGAPNQDAGATDEGNIYLFLGSSAGLPSAPSATFDSPENRPFGGFGASLANAGDVDWDGYADLIVGAPLLDRPLTAAGAAYLHRGGSSGLRTPAVAIASPSPEEAAMYGGAVASAGDLNADGYGDVAVGAAYQDGAVADEGKVFLFVGSPGGTLSHLATLGDVAPTSTRAYVGVSVALVADLNADGYSELVVGASGRTSGAALEGNVFVYLGSAAGIPTTPSIILDNPTNQAGGAFGFAVSSAGSVEGGMPSDLLVAAPWQDAGTTDEGNAFYYRATSSGFAAAPSVTLDNPVGQALSNFGRSVGSGWDFNGDGYPDVAVGVPMLDSVELDVGGVYVYQGGPTGITTTYRDVPSPWTVADTWFGASLGRAL